MKLAIEESKLVAAKPCRRLPMEQQPATEYPAGGTVRSEHPPPTTHKPTTHYPNPKAHTTPL